MMYISTDSVMLNTKGPNQSFGNHLLHLFACWKLSKHLNRELSISCSSNLDEIFNLQKFKNKSILDPILFYTEKYGGNIEEHVEKDIQNNNFFNQLFDGSIQLPSSFYMKGWFWNSIFLPDETFFEKIEIHPELLEHTKIGRGYLEEKTTMVLHYRGTDFMNHSIGWGDLRLRNEFYEKCLLDALNEIDIERLVLVSDEVPDFIFELGIKFGLDIIIERNDWKIDWLILFLSKNLICSNSSFCYTAGWYKKNLCYQPLKFFTRYIDTDLTYPVFPYYNNKQTKIL